MIQQPPGRPRRRSRRVLTPFAKAALAVLRAPLDRLTPVTDAMLRNPPPGDWLHWRRTYDGWAHSPLTQINRDTVKDLKVAWTWSLNSTGGAVNEFTPLVHDGIMFMWNFGETIQALDAKTGTLLWQYSHHAAGRLPVAAGLLQDEAEPRDRRQQAHRADDRHACHRAGRQDGHEVVGCRHRRLQEPAHLQQRPARHQRQGSRRRRQLLAGAREFNRAGPTQEFSRRADASSPATISRPGKQLWRFNTIAQADEPGGDTWNNLPNEKRGGGAIWVVGQYDPELNLTYWGTGSPSPWSTVTRGTFDAKGLYMNSTLALNPDTGKLVWHYQHIGADPYDQDYAFERIVVTVNVQGRPRKAVITVGKPGIFEALDAATGQFLFASDPGAQNVATAIDPVTGVKTLLPEPLPAGVTRCPGNIGARNFPAGSYSPSTNRYYLPIIDTCMGKMGDTPARFLAFDLQTMEFAWDIRTRVPQSSATLTTAGGLLFSATPDRYFRAFDDRDGKVLWESPRLNDIPNAFPITYMVDGKQYIAMPVGNPGLQGNAALGTAPELGTVRGASSSMLWVWQLP